MIAKRFHYFYFTISQTPKNKRGMTISAQQPTCVGERAGRLKNQSENLIPLIYPNS